MAQVVLQKLSKTYPGSPRAAVHKIDLDIRDGEFVVFVGPSGCGKSTLLRMIAGLEEVSAGTVHIAGQEVSQLPPRARNIAMVFQDYALYPHKSVYDNMAFGLRMRKTAPDAIDRQVREAARILQIEDLLERRPRALSGGQRQRVAIGRAMVREPQVFLFDEPLSNLDAQLRAEMRSEIKRLHQRLGKTMIYVTHDQVEAMTLADRIAVLREGQIVQYGSPAEIYAHPAAQFVAAFTGSPAMNFVPAQVLAEGDETCLLLRGLRLPLPASRQAQARALIGRALNFGLRPEHLRLGRTPQAADEVVVAARVLLVEPLGPAAQLTLETQGNEWVMLLSAEQAPPRPGDTVSVVLRLRHGHLFDAATGITVSSPLPATLATADDELVTI